MRRAWWPAVVLVVGAASPTAMAADLAEVKARGAVRVIIAAEEAPETFSFTAGPKPGFEREIMERFAQLQGLRVEVVRAAGYADRIPMLLRGEGDVIAAIFDTPDRRQKVAFTTEVIPTHNVAVTVAPEPPVRTVEELRAGKVGVIRGAKPAEAAAEAGVRARDLVPYDSIDALVRGLKQREVRVAVLPVSELALVSRRVEGLSAGLTVGAPGTVAWAVRKEDAALLAAFDEFIVHFRRGPSWSRLVVEYFGDQALAVLGRAR